MTLLPTARAPHFHSRPLHSPLLSSSRPSHLHFHAPLLLCALLLSLSTSALSFSPLHVRIDQQLTSLDPLHIPVISSALPSISWQLAAFDPSASRNVSQLSYQLRIHLANHSIPCRCPSPSPFPSSSSPTPPITSSACLLYDSGRIESASTLHHRHPSSPSLLPNTPYTLTLMYTSSSLGPSNWTSPLPFRTSLTLNPSPATNPLSPTWIGHSSLPMNELRTSFTLPPHPPLLRATLFYTGLGYSHVLLNGLSLDPSRRLDPGQSPYERLTLYTSLDIAPQLLQPGAANRLTVHLGDGWYTAEQYPRGAQYPTYGPPRMWAELRVEFDGCGVEPLVVRTGLGWEGRQGPVVHSTPYRGEVFDARWETDVNGSLPGAPDPVWQAVAIMPAPAGALVYQAMPPIRAGAASLSHLPIRAWPSLARLGSPLSVSELRPVRADNVDDLYVWVFDMGQVMAGYARVCMAGARGSSIRVVYGEVLEPNISRTVFDSPYGSFVHTSPLRSSGGGDVYIFRGSNATAPECYEPRHTYHGFRYVQVMGVPTGVEVDVVAVVVHSATVVRGSLSFRHALLDQLQQNLQWALRSNLMSIPTDCPQRDERQGWMGDAALTVDTALYNFQLVLFYTNFLSLICAVQLDDGSIPDTVPFTRGFWPAEAAWGSAYVTIAWRLWQHTGDVALLLEHYEGMKRWVDLLLTQVDSAGMRQLNSTFGDWLPPPEFSQVDGALVSAYAVLHDLDLLASIAVLCNHTQDSAQLLQAYARLAALFHTTFYDPALHCYGTGEQAADILALSLRDVVPLTLRETVFTHLLASLSTVGHPTTGVVGTSLLFELLSSSGHHDVALRLLRSTAYPSYGFMFNNAYENATAMWEGWDVPFRGSAMNSRNHHFLASVGAWMYRHVAGIQVQGADEAGRLRVVVHPKWVEEDEDDPLKDVLAQYDSIAGSIVVELHRVGLGSRSVALELPSGVSAELVLDAPQPLASCEWVMEGNHTLWAGGAVNLNGTDISSLTVSHHSSRVTVELSGGSYRFSAHWQLSTPPLQPASAAPTISALWIGITVGVLVLLGPALLGYCWSRRRGEEDSTPSTFPTSSPPLLRAAVDTRPLLEHDRGAATSHVATLVAGQQ